MLAAKASHQGTKTPQSRPSRHAAPGTISQTIQTEQETTNGCWPIGHLHCTEVAALALTPGRPVGSKKRPPVFDQPFDASRVRAGSETIRILAIGLTNGLCGLVPKGM